ncbi:MAG: hypothetical protein ACKVP7_04250 [Hyphomicrobiaceae bacterium]
MANWFTRRLSAAQATPHDTSATMPTIPDDSNTRLGWCLVTFLNDVLEPAESGSITGTELFTCYRRWCADHRLVPINESDFINEIGKFAPEVEMPIKQSGGNITLFMVRFATDLIEIGTSQPHQSRPLDKTL